jgi:hypothetical protein
MNIQRKLEIHAQAVASITNHDDADSTVLLAALDKAAESIAAAKEAVQARAAAQVAAALQGAAQ